MSNKAIVPIYKRVKTKPVEKQVKQLFPGNCAFIVIEAGKDFPNYYRTIVNGYPLHFLYKQDCIVTKEGL